MTPRHRTPPSERTQLYDLPCRDCGHTVQVRLYPEAVDRVPVFCNACLTARIKAIQGERRPRRAVKHDVKPERKSA